MKLIVAKKLKKYVDDLFENNTRNYFNCFGFEPN